MARMCERQDERFSHMQTLLLFRNSANEILGDSCLPDFLELTPISKVMIAPPEIVIDSFKYYMLIAFDYELAYQPCAIVRIPERYTTTTFKERISLS